MRTFLIHFTIFGLVYSSCPNLPGWELVKDGECRGQHSKENNCDLETSAQEATKRCASIDGKPLIIHNEEHQSYWTNRMASNSAIAILGLSCNLTSTQWQWTDGSPLDFKPSSGHYTSHLDEPCRVDGGWYMRSDGSWLYKTGAYVSIFFCTTQLQTLGEDYGCDGVDAEDGGVCFEIADTAQSGLDAQLACQKIGAHAASIHTKQENAFIRRLAVSKGATSGLFLGASLQGKEETFGWIDGSKMDYENYYPGFPKKNFGDCLAMDTSDTAGQWMNTDCAAKLPVACASEQKIASVPTCTGEDYEQDAIITSPGFPYDASIACDYFLAVDAGKKVQVEIVRLEANLCCDSVKLYNGYMGAPLLAKVSGEVHNQTYTSSSNIMRVTWEPNGGVNVKGLEMKYRAV